MSSVVEPQVLNARYRIHSELGRGGMGVVYRAIDMEMNRVVAIKLLPPSLAEDKNLLARFKNEIVNTGQLDHPHIAKIYDIGEAGGAYYYVMELIEGSDLRGGLNEHGRYSIEDACRLLSEIASALDCAHEKGIIHRDVKPENVLIDSIGSVRIVDFGIAKAVGATRMTGGMIGTPEYISPEQARGESTGGASDQYSLAVMAYEMLTGVPPFQTDVSEPWAIVNMHIADDPPDPRNSVSDLPDHVANALLRALEKSPADRFETCKQFIDALVGDFTFTPRPRPKKRVEKSPTNVVKMILTYAIPLILLIIGILFIVKPQVGTGIQAGHAVASQASINESEVKIFIEKTWLPAWKSGQIGPFSKCYDNDNFVGHDYSSKSSFTTLTFDSYLSQWLSKPDSSATQLTDLIAKKTDKNRVITTFTINAGSAGNMRKRLTVDKRPDNSLVVAHEDSAPSSVSLDGLE